jgi:hypothetical protein
MEKLRIEISDENQSIIEFINKTKEGQFSDKENIPQEYIIRFDLPDDIDFLNENESIEQYHFGLTD